MCRKTENDAITLIALIITMIVLLILAGVTLNMVMGDSGIFSKANTAKEQTNIADATENLKIMLLEIKTQVTTEEKRETTVKDCSKLEGKEDVTKIEYISEEIAKTDIVGEEIENPKYALVTYRNYEFKIDKQLRIVGQSGANNAEEDEEIKTGLISNTEYKINNETLIFSHIAVVGENEELKTVKEGFDYLCDNGYKENGAILLRKGSYDFHELQTGSSYNINKKYTGMSISIIADEPGKTFMNSGEIQMVENGSQYSINLKFYRMIFTSDVYSNFHLNGDNIIKEYYNCVFLPPVGGYNGIISTASTNTNNCLFLGGANRYYTSAPLSGKAQNCASTDTTIDPYNGTKETCLTNITVDEEYNITTGEWKHTGTGTNPDGTQASIGVYGGKFAWDNVNIINDTKNKKIIIDTTECYYGIKKIKYKKTKTNDVENILENGIELSVKNKKSIIDNTIEGNFSIAIEFNSGSKILKHIHISGLISDTEYKINNETLKFTHIAVVGKNEELKTFKEGLDYLLNNGYKENSAILLREGSYNFHEIQTGASYNIDTKYNGMNVSIIADNPGKTFLNSGEMVMSENGKEYSIGLKFYRIVFLDDCYGNGTFHLNGDKDVKEYYNCVFKGQIGGYNGIISDASINTYNCLFMGGAHNIYYNYPLKGNAQNCASKDETIDPYNGNKETCLTNANIDEEYKITSEGWKNTGTGTNPDGTQANIGVYGGKYSW